MQGETLKFVNAQQANLITSIKHQAEATENKCGSLVQNNR